jgi:hypothetical protein
LEGLHSMRAICSADEAYSRTFLQPLTKVGQQYGSSLLSA